MFVQIEATYFDDLLRCVPLEVKQINADRSVVVEWDGVPFVLYDYEYVIVENTQIKCD